MIAKLHYHKAYLRHIHNKTYLQCFQPSITNPPTKLVKQTRIMQIWAFGNMVEPILNERTNPVTFISLNFMTFSIKSLDVLYYFRIC